MSADSPCVRGRLTDKHEWFATTPLVLTLLDGRVTSVVDVQRAVAQASNH